MSALMCSSSPMKDDLELHFSFATKNLRRNSSAQQLALFYCIFPLTDGEAEAADAADDTMEISVALRAIHVRGLSNLLENGGRPLVSAVVRTSFNTVRPERFGRSVLRQVEANVCDEPQLDELAAQTAAGKEDDFPNQQRQQQKQRQTVAGNHGSKIFVGRGVVTRYAACADQQKKLSVVMATICDTVTGTPLSHSAHEDQHVLCCFLSSSHTSSGHHLLQEQQYLTKSDFAGRSSSGSFRMAARHGSFSSSSALFPAMSRLNIAMHEWSPAVRPKCISSILLSPAHTQELALKFQKYVVGSAAGKVCAIRASRLVVPITVPGGFCSPECNSFMSFLVDSQAVTAIHCSKAAAAAAESNTLASFSPLQPRAVLNVLLRNCRGEAVQAVHPRLGLSLRQALEMGANHASFEVEWIDYVLLAAAPGPVWTTINTIIDRHFDLIEAVRLGSGLPAAASLALLTGTPVPASQQSFNQALGHLFDVAAVLCPPNVSSADFRAKLVQFFQSDPLDMGGVLSGRRSVRSGRDGHQAPGTARLSSSRLRDALDHSAHSEVSLWKRILFCDSGRHRDLRNILGDIRLTPARVVFCLLPLSQQALVVGEVDQPNRPQLVTKNRAKHFNELREQAASMEEGVVARVRSVFFAKLVGFARIRREIARRRHQLALGLHRRIESRSALPWYKTWCRFATARTSKRKNSMRFLSIVKHDEFLPMRLIFQQWREIAIANSTVRREREATQKVLLDSEADDQLEASREGSKMEEGSLKEEL